MSSYEPKTEKEKQEAFQELKSHLENDENSEYDLDRLLIKVLLIKYEVAQYKGIKSLKKTLSNLLQQRYDSGKGFDFIKNGTRLRKSYLNMLASDVVLRLGQDSDMEQIRINISKLPRESFQMAIKVFTGDSRIDLVIDSNQLTEDF